MEGVRGSLRVAGEAGYSWFTTPDRRGRVFVVHDLWPEREGVRDPLPVVGEGGVLGSLLVAGEGGFVVQYPCPEREGVRWCYDWLLSSSGTTRGYRGRN